LRYRYQAPVWICSPAVNYRNKIDRKGIEAGSYQIFIIADTKRDKGGKIKIRVTQLFDIEHPIIQGGMHYVGFAQLVAAVSNAGGLGIISSLSYNYAA
jgi:hypothetical protein